MRYIQGNFHNMSDNADLVLQQVTQPLLINDSKLILESILDYKMSIQL